MIFPKARKLAKTQGWYKATDGVFGLYKGYFFKVGDGHWTSNPSFKYVVATTGLMSEEQQSKIRKTLFANKKELKYSTVEVERNSITFVFFENLSLTKLKTVYALFDFLADLFKEVNIPEQNRCHTCGPKEYLNFYTHNENGTILCNTCFHKLESKYNILKEESAEEEKNYITGFFGSVIFSIPGIIAWVLLAVFVGMLASGMAILITILGMKGYEYFKGRQGPLTKYLIVLSGLLSIVLANVITIIALLKQEGLTLSQSWSELFLNDLAQDLLWKNTLISFVLAIIVWLWLLSLPNNDGVSIKLATTFDD